MEKLLHSTRTMYRRVRGCAWRSAQSRWSAAEDAALSLSDKQGRGTGGEEGALSGRNIRAAPSISYAGRSGSVAVAVAIAASNMANNTRGNASSDGDD